MNKNLGACLNVKNNELYVEEVSAADLAKNYGTPIFVMSESQIRANYKRFHAAFSNHWKGKSVDILPAIKANWIQAVRDVLTQEGAGCDIFSEGELEIALRSGAKPEKISVNGGGKSENYIQKCIETGVRITVDDIDEIYLIDKVAARIGKRAAVRFRLRPQIPNAWQASDFSLEVVPVDMAFQVYKSGVPSEYIVELAKFAHESDHIDLKGFHIHIGRHHRSFGVWRNLLRGYCELLVLLRKELGGYEPEEIDIGGGFPTPRDPFFKKVNRWDIPLTAVLWCVFPLLNFFGLQYRYSFMQTILSTHAKMQKKARRAPEIEQYAQVTCETLNEELSKSGFDISKMILQVEPGRSFYSDAGIHLTKVDKIKTQTKPIKWNWVLTDTSYFFFSGGVFEFNKHDFVVANKVADPMQMYADIVGKSCYADRIIPEVNLPKIEQGDLIAILDAGAYQEVSASNFNALPRPATVMVNKSQSAVIRKAESVQDVLSRDQSPPWMEDIVANGQMSDPRKEQSHSSVSPPAV